MPYAVIGGGVAVGVLGAIFATSAQSSYDDFYQAIKSCNDTAGGAGCTVDSTISGMRDSGDTKKSLAYVSYGIAGAAIIAGSALVYLNRKTSYEITADEYRREQSKKTISITPVVAPGTAGAMVFGRFNHHDFP
jgi:hypothetical protein